MIAIVTCPKCKAEFKPSNLHQFQWNTVQFSCTHCNQKIGLLNVTQDSTSVKMKKIAFKETCTNCKQTNTIYTLESSIGKTIKNKCLNCKTMMMVNVPNPITGNQTIIHQVSGNKTTVVNSNNTSNSRLIINVLPSDKTKAQYFEIIQPFLTIGRKNQTESQPDIAIETEDTMMSRVHAIIKRNEKNNTFSIQDNGSTNHTFINEKQLKSFDDQSKNEILVLQNGDQIRLGRTMLNVTIQ